MTVIKQYFSILIKFIKKYIWPILIFSMFLIITYLLKITNCPVKLITGMPCPGCGMTRAGFAVLRLDFVEALKYNPLIFIFPIIVWIIVFNERPIISKIYKNNIFWTIILIMVVSVYVLRLIFVYPDVPMDYYENNLIKFIISLFN